MFKDVKTFLSSFLKKVKEHDLFKKYLGITLAAILAILIPIVIAVLYIQFKDEQIVETQVDEITVTMFDNDGHTITSDKAPSNELSESAFVDIVYNMVNAKTLTQKPEDFNKTPTFNLSIATTDTPVSYKCYFEKNVFSSFIEDSSGNFFALSENEYTTFLNSSFAQTVYPESTPPSLTIEKDISVLPQNATWSYKLTDGTLQESTNIKTESETVSYMISGAIDFSFSDIPSECNIKIQKNGGNVVFDGSLEGIADFTADDGDKFTVFITAKWEDVENELAFGTQNYEFEIICTKPSTIEITPQSALGGTLVKISISDVNNPDTIIYTVKSTADEDSPIKGLCEFTPTFIKNGQNAYAFLPIPNGIGEDTFEFSVSYGIAKADFSISLAERSTPKVITPDDGIITFDLTDKTKNEFSKILANTTKKATDTILFTSAFLSPNEYGLTKSIEYNSEISTEETAFKFLAESYTAPSDELISIKSANIGTVRAVGYSELLGNYVAVDHGAGLYTWYCGLSDVGVAQGDILKKGAFIGRSGSTAPLCQNGVNIFCTLYENLINPSDVLGQKLV